MDVDVKNVQEDRRRCLVTIVDRTSGQLRTTPSKKEKKRKRDKRLPEQQYQPQFYYKPIPSMSVPAAIQSSSIPVGFLGRLPSTERRLMTRLEQSSAAAAPVVSSSRSALHSKKVSIFRKPQTAISNEPTRYQPKYQEYFAKAGEDDSIDAVDKQPVSRRVGTNEAIKSSHNHSTRRKSRDRSAVKDDAVDKQPGEADPNCLLMDFNDWLDEADNQLILKTLENLPSNIDTIDV